tara:strand:+ start:66 stop:299 length:234 start_codon:yes stop_codon:yes gene_type:complete
MGNVSLINHIIHFILGILSNYYSYIVPLFLIYQIIDGYKFNYKVKLEGEKTDDIQMDLLLFSLGAISLRIINFILII